MSDILYTHRTARLTGLSYFGLAVTGGLGYLMVRSSLLSTGDSASTLSNILSHESLARIGVALEIGIVLTQAITALLFFRLFRGINSVAAGSVAAFGLANAMAILVSAALLATTIDVAFEPSLAPVGDAAATVQLLYTASGNLWSVGGVFFGLWLVPMGWLVLESGWMPRTLGWILLVGGVGYVISAFATYLAPDVPALADALTIPASIGEFWVVAYLLFKGVSVRDGDKSWNRTPAVANS